MLNGRPLKIISTLSVALCLSLVLTVGATAASQKLVKKISAVYQNMKIYVDGKLLTTSEEPFVLDGKGVTMVPLRVISEALGKEVTWVGENSSIYIGKIPDDLDLPSETEQPQETPIEKMTVLRNVGPFYEFKSRNFMIAKRPFTGGVAAELTENSAEIVLELNGKYRYLEGYLGVDDETMNSSSGFRVLFYGDDLRKFSSNVIKPADYPAYVKIDVEGIKRLRITALKEEASVDGNTVGEYDKLIAVLANFKFYK